jgi:hypothetical protein
MSLKSPPRDDTFIQEYLYIEESYELPQVKTEEKDKEEEVERGVIIIDLF